LDFGSAMERRHPLGRIARLWRYPVKSLAAEPLQAVRVGTLGLEGDRAQALFVSDDRQARSGRTYRGKENNLLHTVATAERGIELAMARGVDVALRDGGPHFDDAPVSIVFDTWICELENLTGMALDPLRFRSNLFVTAEPGFTLLETDLLGTIIESGDVAFEVLAPIVRCVTPSYDIETGHSDPQVLRTIVHGRGNVLGIYCAVKRAGTLAAGETLTASGDPREPSQG
jgi:hypothetical protein